MEKTVRRVLSATLVEEDNTEEGTVAKIMSLICKSDQSFIIYSDGGEKWRVREKPLLLKWN